MIDNSNRMNMIDKKCHAWPARLVRVVYVKAMEKGACARVSVTATRILLGTLHMARLSDDLLNVKSENAYKMWHRVHESVGSMIIIEADLFSAWFS